MTLWLHVTAVHQVATASKGHCMHLADIHARRAVHYLVTEVAYFDASCRFEGR